MNLRHLTMCAALLLPMTGFAESKKSMHDHFTGQGYGAAGCGLGSVIFGQKKGFVQVFAATTNGTFGNQTFGITSGTSNCGESAMETSLLPFVKTNKAQLANNIVKGSGEALVSLNEMVGCKNSAAFNKNLQANYETVFYTGATDEAISNNILASAQSSCI